MTSLSVSIWHQTSRYPNFKILLEKQMKNQGLSVLLTAGLALGICVEASAENELELSLNLVRTDSISIARQFTIASAAPQYASAPIRASYQFSEKIKVIAGFALLNAETENGQANTTIKGNTITIGAQTTTTTGILLEGLYSRITSSVDNGDVENDFVGNQFEVFLGKRFSLNETFFIEPKAGITFGTITLDDNETDQSFVDGFGTEAVLSIGFAL